MAETMSEPAPATAGAPPLERAEAPLPWHVRAKFTVLCAVLATWLRCFGLAGLYALGWVFGLFEWLINFRLRGRFIRQVRQLLGDQMSWGEALAASRRFVQRLRCDKLLYLVLDRVSTRALRRRVEFVGVEKVDAVLEGGRGVHVLTSHHGAHHVAGMLMARLGYELVGVRDRHEGASRRYIQERFARTLPASRAFQLVFADAFPLVLYRAFRRPTLVCAALDVSRRRSERQRTARVRLFGGEREFLCGTVHMAMRCGAPVFQSFVIGRPFYRYRIEFRGPLWSSGAGEGDNEAAVAAVMQRYAEGIESFVRRHPCHLSRF